MESALIEHIDIFGTKEFYEFGNIIKSVYCQYMHSREINKSRGYFSKNKKYQQIS